jgi:exopolyphosphatase/guanosine-5'-triphosphate,3'-diphosphate pyrophosphatase
MRRPGTSTPSTVAAVDLGSNSFHVIVARHVKGQLHVIDRMAERVALAAGLDSRDRLTERAQRRALQALERFGQRLRAMPPGSVRAVGTNALRQARNAGSFLQRARRVLGHPIEIISGREEARLIYLGVAHDVADDAGRRLVVDIGGGSTECILGERFEPRHAESLYMGCVGYGRRFFPEGRIRRGAFEKAMIAALLELRSMERRFRALGWDTCLGSSGTILAADRVLREEELSRHGITPRGIEKLIDLLLSAGHVDDLALAGLEPERAAVFPAGVAILCAVVEALRIERMHVSTGALREGVLHDLLGRIRHEDVRDDTIRRFQERHHADLEQAASVERAALALLEKVSASWRLEGEAPRRLLRWAASLHEVGLSVSHAGHHKHGAYIVAHSDLPGFSRSDQEALASLIRSHRRRLAPDEWRAVPGRRAAELLRLCVLLRLAVRFCRDRAPRPLPAVVLSPRPEGLRLTFPAGWLAAHPLTRAELAEEAECLAGVGFDLRVR